MYLAKKQPASLRFFSPSDIHSTVMADSEEVWKCGWPEAEDGLESYSLNLYAVRLFKILFELLINMILMMIGCRYF